MYNILNRGLFLLSFHDLLKNYFQRSSENFFPRFLPGYHQKHPLGILLGSRHGVSSEILLRKYSRRFKDVTAIESISDFFINFILHFFHFCILSEIVHSICSIPYWNFLDLLPGRFRVFFFVPGISYEITIATSQRVRSGIPPKISNGFLLEF